MQNILIDPSSERKIADLRNLGMKDVLTLGRYQYASAHRPLKRHTHGDMFEICLLDEGVQTYIIEGKEYILKGGDILVIFPNERHGTGSNLENRGRLYWLLVQKPSPRERFLNLPAVEGQKLVEKLLNISPRHFRGDRNLKMYLENIFAAYDRKNDPFRVTETQNWSLRFLLDLVRSSTEQPELMTPTMRHIQQIIEERIFEIAPQLSELAELSGLSLSRFKERFKHEIGVAPGNYIIQQKIEKAKQQLIETDTDVTTLAFKLGFSSSQYFATAFRRYTGTSPSEFRTATLNRYS